MIDNNSKMFRLIYTIDSDIFTPTFQIKQNQKLVNLRIYGLFLFSDTNSYQVIPRKM
jgi:hypothetical protein